MTKISIIKRILIIAILTLSATAIACVASVFAFPSDTPVVEQEDANVGLAASSYKEESATSKNGLSIKAVWNGCSIDVATDINTKGVVKEKSGFGAILEYNGWICKKSGNYIYTFNSIIVEIDSYEDLIAVRKDVNGKTKFSTDFLDNMSMSSSYITYKLTADIVIGNYWEPIGKAGSSVDDHSTSFCGTFDGNGYIITMNNFGVSDWDKSDATTESTVRYGLFSRVHGATIKNLYLEINSVNINHQWSGIFGNMFDFDENTNFYVGGLVGYCTDTKISMCYIQFNKQIVVKTAMRYVYFGGVAGRMNSACSVDNCCVEFSSAVKGVSIISTYWGYINLDALAVLGGIVGTGNPMVVNSILDFNNIAIALQADLLTGENVYSVGADHTGAGLVVVDFPEKYIQKQDSVIIDITGNGWWADIGSDEYTKELNYGDSKKYNNDGWDKYLTNINGSPQLTHMTANNKDKWYYAQKDHPIQGWFARIEVRINNARSGSNDYHPDSAITTSAIRLNQNISWSEFYENANQENGLASQYGYSFRGFSGDDSLSKTIGDGGYYQKYNEDGEGYASVIDYKSSSAVTSSGLGKYNETEKCYDLYAMWVLYQYEIEFTSRYSEEVGMPDDTVIFYGWGNSLNEQNAEYSDNDDVEYRTEYVLKEWYIAGSRGYIKPADRGMIEISDSDGDMYSYNFRFEGNSSVAKYKFYLDCDFASTVVPVFNIKVFAPNDYDNPLRLGKDGKSDSLTIYYKDDCYYLDGSYFYGLDTFVLEGYLADWAEDNGFGDYGKDYRVLGFTIGKGLAFYNDSPLASKDDYLPNKLVWDGEHIVASYPTISELYDGEFNLERLYSDGESCYISNDEDSLRVHGCDWCSPYYEGTKEDMGALTFNRDNVSTVIKGEVNYVKHGTMGQFGSYVVVCPLHGNKCENCVTESSRDGRTILICNQCNSTCQFYDLYSGLYVGDSLYYGLDSGDPWHTVYGQDFYVEMAALSSIADSLPYVYTEFYLEGGYADSPIQFLNIYPIVMSEVRYNIYLNNEIKGDYKDDENTYLSEIVDGDNIASWGIDIEKYVELFGEECRFYTEDDWIDVKIDGDGNFNKSEIEGLGEIIGVDALDGAIDITLDKDRTYIRSGSWGDLYLKAKYKGKIEVDWS